LHDEAADVRENSARALGHLGAREAVAELRQLRSDPQQRVRSAVDEALKRLEAADKGANP
jgi:HEAT repeat protein